MFGLRYLSDLQTKILSDKLSIFSLQVIHGSVKSIKLWTNKKYLLINKPIFDAFIIYNV